MRVRIGLVYLLAAFVLLSAYSCSRPDTQESFVRADQCSDGIYDFEFELSDSLATYDFWMYSRTEEVSFENLELRVLWTSPSGETMRETVYMKAVDKNGERELYRSGVVPAELGIWKINIRPLPVDSGITGLGMICKSNFDGTR